MNTETTKAQNKMFYVILLIRLSCFFVFAGRGWQHILGDVPLRALLWDEELMTPLVKALTGMTWDQYATSALVDASIQNFIHASGIFYFVCAIASLTVRSSSKGEKIALTLGTISLTFLAALYWKEKFYQFGQFFEYAAQVCAPALLIWATSRTAQKFDSRKFDYALRMVVGLTFVCHGLYAIGYYPVPGNFIDMTIGLLQVNDETALSILKLFGVADFLIGLSLLTGVAMSHAYAYAATWGFGTSVARIIANTELNTFSSDFVQWVPETLYRMPHALIPLAAWFWLRARGSTLTARAPVRATTADDLAFEL